MRITSQGLGPRAKGQEGKSRRSGDEVGEEEQEEDQGEDEEIHVEAEKDASVVEAPAALHAACGVYGAGDGGECGQNKPERGAQVGWMREQDGAGTAAEDNDVCPNQRWRARVEDARRQGFSLVLRVCLFERKEKAKAKENAETQRTQRNAEKGKGKSNCKRGERRERSVDAAKF